MHTCHVVHFITQMELGEYVTLTSPFSTVLKTTYRCTLPLWGHKEFPCAVPHDTGNALSPSKFRHMRRKHVKRKQLTKAHTAFAKVLRGAPTPVYDNSGEILGL